jgi:hypothetical protein
MIPADHYQGNGLTYRSEIRGGSSKTFPGTPGLGHAMQRGLQSKRNERSDRNAAYRVDGRANDCA